LRDLACPIRHGVGYQIASAARSQPPLKRGEQVMLDLSLV
jgi:hypothetical protein